MSADKKLYFEVITTRKGYFNKSRVREGSLMSVCDEEFSESWMKKTKDIKPEKKKVITKKKEKIEEDVI
jgi:hypothetical protein